MNKATIRHPVDFDAETHTYRVNGEVVPGVTSIIRCLSDFTGVPVERLERAGERGSAVHLLTEMSDKGGLRYRITVPEEYAAYVEAWHAFTKDYRPKFLGIEERLYHPEMGYCGTADRIAVIDGEAGILDLKTTWRLHPECGVQLAAYLEAANTMRQQKLTRRWAIQLRNDGTYDFQEFTRESDWNTFLACLQIYLWKMETSTGRHGNGVQLLAKEHAEALEWLYKEQETER